MVLRRGTSASRSRRSCVWHPRPHLPAWCSTSARPGTTPCIWPRFGLAVLGIDVAETASAIARSKAEGSGLQVEFVAADAYHLDRLGRRFQTVLDVEMFHTCDGDERPAYVASLATVTEPGATLYLLCFSDEGPDTGLHPVRRDDVAAAVRPEHGMEVVTIEPTRATRGSTATTGRPPGSPGSNGELTRRKPVVSWPGSASLRADDQTADVRIARTRSENSRPPATGRNHPGARRDRTATIFTTIAPTTAQPIRPCTNVRVLTGSPSGKGADLEAQRPQAVVGDEEGEQQRGGPGRAMQLAHPRRRPDPILPKIQRRR